PNLGARVLSIDDDTRDAVTVDVECSRAHAKTVLGCGCSWNIGGIGGSSAFHRKLTDPGPCRREQTAPKQSGGPLLKQASPGQANRIVVVVLVHRWMLMTDLARTAIVMTVRVVHGKFQKPG